MPSTPDGGGAERDTGVERGQAGGSGSKGELSSSTGRHLARAAAVSSLRLRRHTQSSRRDVRCDHDWVCAILELLEHPVPLLLALVAVQTEGREAVGAKPPRELPRKGESKGLGFGAGRGGRVCLTAGTSEAVAVGAEWRRCTCLFINCCLSPSLPLLSLFLAPAVLPLSLSNLSPLLPSPCRAPSFPLQPLPPPS